MNQFSKILTIDQLPQWREDLKQQNKILVVTNGCFDIIHAGHINYLRQARTLGDVLLVGVNSDESIRKIKGPDRPIFCLEDRLTILSELKCIDALVVFEETTAERLLESARPDIYVKGGDYTLDKLNPKEKGILERLGTKIVILPLTPGRSTTAIAKKIASL